MPNQVTLTFGGDADQLQQAARDAEQAAAGVGDSATRASQDMANAAQESGAFSDRMSNLGNVVDGASTAIGDAAATLQALADVQDMARANAVRLERATNDVAQAQEDYNQAVLDGKQATVDATQAGIDYEQAQLDARVALDDYNAAVAEYGAGSAEAAQAQIDLKQANADATQAQLDQEQAIRDGEQALIDAKSATLDLSDAQHEADPGPLQALADAANTFAPILQGVIGIVALATAAQWLWNTALFASPITWIIVAITALIAVIVWIATQTTWFQDLWTAAWSFIQSAAAAVWDWLKQVPGWIGTAFAVVFDLLTLPFRLGWDFVKAAAQNTWDFLSRIPGWIGSAFRTIGDGISAPFRFAFNLVARAWNSTIGSLSWTVPDWVPVIGGSTISAPRLPTFHQGGRVPGAPGSEMLAILQAGEEVIPANRAGAGGGGGPLELRVAPGADSALASLLMRMVRTGELQLVAS